MSNDYFRFKQFTIIQSGAAMKVGVDSVLLGSWVIPSPALPDKEPFRILDIGTGTGLLALMMAQRFPEALIDAIEIDEEACCQAKQNIANSSWAKRICIIYADFRDFMRDTDTHYDLIICNPPYFTDSLKSPDTRRCTARHNDCLPHTDIVTGAAKLLRKNGLFSVVLPLTEANKMITEANKHQLFVQRILHLQSHPSKPIHRLLIEFSKEENTVYEQSLCVSQPDLKDYTADYKNMTKDFYLKF